MSEKLLRIELRRNIGWWALPLLLAGTGLLGWFDFQEPVMFWTESVVLIRDVALFGGPLIGGVAAFMAGRDRRRSIEELAGTTPRPELSRRLTTWTATLTSGLLAYVLAGAAILVITAVRATWGSPEPWPIVVGVLSVLAQSALGYATGHYLPSRLTAPLAAIGLFAAQLAPYLFFRQSWLRSLSPSSDLLTNSSVWYGIQPDGIGPPQALFLFGLAALGLAIFAVRVRRSILSWGVLASGVLITAAGMATVSQAAPSTMGPIPRYEITDYEPVCEEGRITVCAHPAYEPRLEEIAATTQRMSEPLAGLPGLPERARQIPTSAYAPKPEPKDRVMAFAFGGATPEANQISAGLVRAPENTYAYQVNSYEQFSLDPEAVQETESAIQAWLLRRSGREIECAGSSSGSPMTGSPSVSFSVTSCKAADRFAALGTEQRRQWLEENYADLRAGEVRLEDLP